MRAVLRHPALDPAFKALVLTLPGEGYVAEQLTRVDPQKIHAAHRHLCGELAARLHDDWAWAFDEHQVREGYAATPAQAGRRALANLALAMLCQHAARSANPVWPGRAYQRVKDAGNMTDRLGALVALVDSHSDLADAALARFHAQAGGDALVVDKWFAVQAGAAETLGDAAGRTFARTKALLKHPDFTLKNPNRARSLLFPLCLLNPAAFHRADAAGYVLWAERLVELDALNPQLAARLARAMDRWSVLAEPYRSAAREAIVRVAARSDLSADVQEILHRALEAGE
jgi:aminopeptidase N